MARADGAWTIAAPSLASTTHLVSAFTPYAGLADARAKRDKARKLLAAGTDPGKAERAADMEQATNSFEVVAVGGSE